MGLSLRTEWQTANTTVIKCVWIAHWTKVSNELKLLANQSTSFTTFEYTRSTPRDGAFIGNTIATARMYSARVCVWMCVRVWVMHFDVRAYPTLTPTSSPAATMQLPNETVDGWYNTRDRCVHGVRARWKRLCDDYREQSCAHVSVECECVSVSRVCVNERLHFWRRSSGVANKHSLVLPWFVSYAYLFDRPSVCLCSTLAESRDEKHSVNNWSES